MFLEEAFVDKKEGSKIVKWLQKFIDYILGLHETNANLFYNYDALDKLKKANQEMRDLINSGTLDFEEKGQYRLQIRLNEKTIKELEPQYRILRDEQISLIRAGKALAERAQAWLERVNS